MLSENPPVAELIAKLEQVLHELWLSEAAWGSLEVFAPIYDLLCKLMAIYGITFARNSDQWHVGMSG